MYQSIQAKAKADFSRSSGPGGQNVNKVNTKVTLRINLNDLAGLSNAEIQRLRDCLASRITIGGELVVSASEERSQRINLERAYARMEALIANTARLPRIRRPTKPGPAAREERLSLKRHRARKKTERSFRDEE